MTCECCESSTQLRQPGGYQPAGRIRMQCLGCCARLVLSARPDKAQARAMLKAIELSGVAPSRADALEEVKRRPHAVEHQGSGR